MSSKDAAMSANLCELCFCLCNKDELLLITSLLNLRIFDANIFDILFIICGYDILIVKYQTIIVICPTQRMSRIKYGVSSIKYMQKYKGTYMVEKGNPQWFTDLPLIKQQLKHYPLFLYQREPIDIGFEMVKQNVRTITYINKHKYQTIVAKPEKASQTKNQVSANMDQKLLQFLRTHKFYVRRSYLDIHPRSAYSSLCHHLGTKKDPEHIRIYNYCHFTKHQIPINTIFLPYIQQLRYQYRQTNQLKLKKLDRLRNPTQQQINQAIEHWKQKFELPQIYKSTKEEQKYKKIFAFQNKLGKYVTIEQLLEGQGSTSYYAQWENQIPAHTQS